MKDTNEIEKQLQHKADKYIEQKAEEMFEIHREIAQYLGGRLPNYIDYITDYSDYSNDLVANRGNYFTSSSPSSMQLKYRQDLAKNYKEKLVAKYTRELIMKLDIFE
tara:strand:- start:1005 stop:1325 length:321 start_codon:yes stop_codon:yes gene_type:complete